MTLSFSNRRTFLGTLQEEEARRKAAFKSGIDGEKAKETRGKTTTSLREKKREIWFNKRRVRTSDESVQNVGGPRPDDGAGDGAGQQIVEF